MRKKKANKKTHTFIIIDILFKLRKEWGIEKHSEEEATVE